MEYLKNNVFAAELCCSTTARASIPCLIQFPNGGEFGDPTHQSNYPHYASFRIRRSSFCASEIGKKRNAGNWIDVSDHRIHLRWEIESNTGLRLAAVVQQAKTLFLRYSIVNAVF